MSGIQLILTGGVGLIFLYYILRVRSALIDLILLSSFAAIAVYFILLPDYTSRIAHWLGVGRGADLLFYICILFFLFVVLKLFARIRRLEKALTELVRQDARSNTISFHPDTETKESR